MLYAAKPPEAAICESLLHEVPAKGGATYHADYSAAGLGRFASPKKLNLAQFMGNGLRRLGLDHRQIVSTNAAHYDVTVQWMQEAHRAGFDGMIWMIWMIYRRNTDAAVILPGDRGMESECKVDTGYA